MSSDLLLKLGVVFAPTILACVALWRQNVAQQKDLVALNKESITAISALTGTLDTAAKATDTVNQTLAGARAELRALDARVRDALTELSVLARKGQVQHADE